MDSGNKRFSGFGMWIGRHSILFGKSNFNVNLFLILVKRQLIGRWAERENLKFDYSIGDMNLPYEDDLIAAHVNVISHTDTV